MSRTRGSRLPVAAITSKVASTNIRISVSPVSRSSLARSTACCRSDSTAASYRCGAMLTDAGAAGPAASGWKGGSAMALTLVLGELSPEGMQGLIKEGLAARERYFRDLAESVDMKVHGYYFAEGGEWDLVVLLEAQEESGADTLATSIAT